jgi:hypothetical protein
LEALPVFVDEHLLADVADAATLLGPAADSMAPSTRIFR